MSNLYKYVVLYLLIITYYFQNVTNTTDPGLTDTNSTEVVCNSCKCYKIKCTRLEFPDENCVDQYKESCDNNGDIVEADNCHEQCDCCLETKCVSWTSYHCIIYRTFEFSVVLYFVLISFNLFLVFKTYSHMFDIDNKKLTNFNQEKKEKIKMFSKEKFNLKFGGLLLIKKVNDSFVNIPKDRFNAINNLFLEFDKNKAIGIRNMLQLAIIFLLYLCINFCHFYFIFTMPSQPYAYGKLCWIQHGFLFMFLLLIYLVFKKINVYGVKMRETISKFERDQKCKVKINKIRKLIDFNFENKGGALVNNETGDNLGTLRKEGIKGI